MWKAPDGRDPRELAAMDLDVHLADKRLHGSYVETMFDVLAPGYDVFTRCFSFGMDRDWKSLLVARCAERAAANPLIVDLACGTGDLGKALGRRLGARCVLGLDISRRMLEEARTGGGLALAACDMHHLCLPAGAADIVSVGYGLRNNADPEASIREIARMLRPGGLLLTLDFYRPAGPLWRELFLFYMRVAGSFAGWLWHRVPVTYGYIAPSIRRYYTIAEFESALASAGLLVEWRATRIGGAIAMHIARKPAP